MRPGGRGLCPAPFLATATQLDTLSPETVHSLETASRRLEALTAYPPLRRT